jgi:hypothetical protein
MTKKKNNLISLDLKLKLQLLHSLPSGLHCDSHVQLQVQNNIAIAQLEDHMHVANPMVANAAAAAGPIHDSVDNSLEIPVPQQRKRVKALASSFRHL